MICKSAIYYFLSGAFAWGFLVHLGYSMFGVLPLTFGGLELTTSLNSFAMLASAGLSLLFAYLGYNSHVEECHIRDNE